MAHSRGSDLAVDAHSKAWSALQVVVEWLCSASDFGNHSGLGLAISKQIVEAHRGVVWAENIRPVDADRSVPSQGARFVVGLPI